MPRGPDPPSSILHPQPILLAGPTAVGKSDVALSLAQQLGGEIISVDSMQVYRGLDIGTAKPSPADRARVPHHLIDGVEINESFDAAKFVELAHKAVGEIQSRARTDLCGGRDYLRRSVKGWARPRRREVRAGLEATRPNCCTS